MKCPQQTLMEQLVWLQTSNVFIRKKHLPTAWRKGTRNQVEVGGLAGAIGTDKACD